MIQFVHAGLQCRMIFSTSAGRDGYWCGYAAVPTGHALHGLDCNTEIDAPDWINGEPCKAGPIDIVLLSTRDSIDRLPISVALNVHGGVNYSGKMRDADGQWWFGFDCAHADDTPENCDEAYVRAEVEKMAERLAALATAPTFASA